MSDTQTLSFLTASPKKQLELIPELVKDSSGGLTILTEFLQTNQPLVPNLVTAKIYQVLHQLQTSEAQQLLDTYFPQGFIPLTSERNIDYQPLAHLLLTQNWQEADTLTRVKMCELAGDAAIARKWVYFTEVQQFPSSDLQTLNQLWYLFSEGKFGFAVQRKIWLGVGKDFDKLWPKIGWKNGNEWTRYPNAFTWDLSAPIGHLPLLNQIRGVRVIASLFAHPTWLE